MEPESSSPYPQVTAIRPYPEPTPSSPHDPLQLPEVILILKHSVKLRRYLLRGGVAACPGMACVLCAVQSSLMMVVDRDM